MHRRKPLGFRRQRGAVAILLTVAMVALLAMAGLTLDGGHLMLNKSRLQNAVDAAALSGAKTLSQTYGVVGAGGLARKSAEDTLLLNADAEGNGELARAIAERGGVGNFANVEFSTSVYGPFAADLPPDNARYVRVTVANHGLVGFFWRFLDSIGAGDLGEKRVAAVATAGPSPTQPCDLAPLMVCGDETKHDPANGLYWGYRFGQLEVLKTAAGDNSPVGSGNFQLIRLGDNKGGDDIREALAGGINRCSPVGESVQTEPGNKIGPAIQGLNVIFAQYKGSMKPGDYPSDMVVDYSSYTASGNGKDKDKDKDNDNGSKASGLTLNSEVSPARIEYQGSPAHSDADGNVYTESGAQLFDYKDWRKRSAECAAGNGLGCQRDGVFERRILKIVIGRCSGTDAGQTSVPVLGYGCYFILQPADQKGNEAQIFGQFVKECSADGYPGPNPSADAGPQIIQLYKSYIGSGVGVPSNDS